MVNQTGFIFCNFDLEKMVTKMVEKWTDSNIRDVNEKKETHSCFGFRVELIRNQRGVLFKLPPSAFLCIFAWCVASVRRLQVNTLYFYHFNR